MNNKVAVITGGTGAIGTSICKLFSAQGYTVIANCHPSDEQRSAQHIQQAGINATVLPFDVGDSAVCENAINDIESSIGPISILVNAAGITRDAKLTKLEPEQWSEVMRTNLDSVYNVTRPVIAPMTERGFGRIINISSVNGQRGQIGQTNYSAAKAGMTGFTRALAREVARDGITVNSVSPGYVQSPMVEAIPSRVLDKVIYQIPVGRFAEPIEIARAVEFLANENSGYITGIDLPINGGFHIA